MKHRYLQHQQLVRRDVVVLDRLSVRYQDRVILQNLSLHIYDGQSVAILGEAGAGKTLLLATLQGLVRPASGQMTLFGAPAPPIARDIRQHIGVMPHFPQTHHDSTVQDVLQTSARQYGLLLQQRTLEDYAGRYELAPALLIARLTPLQLRLLVLAVSIIHDPQLVLLDEPLSGLSVSARNVVDSYIRQMQREGRTIVVTFDHATTHSYLNTYDIIVTL